jgi:hypothetical protein
MVLFFPCRLFVTQEGEQPPAAKLGARSLHEKGATPTGTDDLVDLFD